MIQITEKYLKADDGIKLFMRSWLPPDLPLRVILCLHGLSSHSLYFSSFGYALAEKGNALYAIDLRGNGLSGTPGIAESVDRQIADIKLVFEHLRSLHPATPFYLLGASIGAGYAMRFVFLNPQAINGLILIAPPVKTISSLSLRLLLTMVTMYFRLLLNPRGRWDTSIAWSKAFRKSEMGHFINNDPHAVKEYTYRYTINMMQVSGKALLRYAATLKLPVLILQGTEDSVVKATGTQSLYKHLGSKEKQLIMLPQTAHDIYGIFIPTRNTLSESGRDVFEIIQKWFNQTNGGQK